MARLFSSPKRHRGCFTGLHFGSIFKLCSASSLGTPFMSAGYQAKMSLFSWRNSTSALSYLGSRFIPMAVVLEASPTTSSTGLISMAALNAGAELEICFFDAGIDLALDILEFFAIEDSFCVGCFSNLAVSCFGKASGYGDDTV